MYSRRCALNLLLGWEFLPVVAGCAGPASVNLRVLTYNIHHGAGTDGRMDLQRIAQIIRESKADLVALQEVDRGVQRTGQVDQPQRLAELTGMHAVFGGNIALQDGEYGNAVLTRLPVDKYRNHLLPRNSGNEQRGLLEVHFRVNGGQVVLLVTHLDHQSDDGERLASMEVLRGIVGQRRKEPVIVAGDFNDIPDSRVMRSTRTFLRDGHDSATGAGFTYPAGVPDRRTDYILYTVHPSLACHDQNVIPEAVASDHRPVLAEFQMKYH